MMRPATIGSLLRDLRGRRGVSLRQLADTAGLGARTLSYWESGEHTPHLPELEAVLTALSASPEERAQAFALVSTPRAARRLAAERAATRRQEDLGPTPSGGDLLRAMRRRRHLVAEEVAARLGVTGATVSRWESGKAVPDADRLAMLLDVLDAHPEERAALSGPQGSLLFLISPLGATASLAMLREQFLAFRSRLILNPVSRVNDLHYLVFEAQARSLAAHDDVAYAFYIELCARRATFLSGAGRFQEAGRYAERALDLLPSDLRREDFVLEAVIASARSQAYGGAVAKPQRGIEALCSWEDVPMDFAHAAWIQSEIAEFLRRSGQGEAAVTAALRACRLAERYHPNEVRLRQHDLARIYLHEGCAEVALRLVTVSAEDAPFWRASTDLLRAEGQILLGDAAAAQECLARVYSDIRRHDLELLRLQADALVQRLRSF